MNGTDAQGAKPEPAADSALGTNAQRQSVLHELRRRSWWPDRRRMLRLVERPLFWFVLLCTLFTARYLTQPAAPISTSSPYAHGDGVYYYVYLRSLLFDGDLDFSNDLALVGQPFNLGISEKTGRPKNFWTGGSAIFWAPFAIYARAQLAVTNALGWTSEPNHGAGHIFQRITLFGSVAWGLCALWLSMWIARQGFGKRAALFGMFGIALASPLAWYMLRQPSFSHAASAAAVALFVAYWFRSEGRRTWRGWFVLGALLGVAMLVRPQNALHVVLPLWEWLTLALAALRQRDRKRLMVLVGQGLAFGATTTGVYMLQVLAWNRIYGRWVLDAHNASFLHFGSSRLFETLFSSRMGLFAWHPLVYVAVLGLVGAAVARPLPERFRRFAVLGVVVVLLQAFVNGAAVDWWAGWSFGGRRFSGCTVYFVFGLSAAVAGLVALAQRFSQLLVKVLLPAAILLVPIAFNHQLAEDYAFRRIPPGLPQNMLALWTGAASRGMEAVYEKTGNLGSVPLNWWLAAAADVSPAKYDLLSSAEIFYDRNGPVPIALTDPRHALAGFSVPEQVEGRLASWVEPDGATFGFALRRTFKLVGHVDVYVPAVPAKVSMSVGGEVVLDKEVPAKGWHALPFEIERAQLRSGINLARVKVAGEGGGMRSAWSAVHLAKALAVR